MAIAVPVREAIRSHLRKGKDRRAVQAVAVSAAVGEVLALVMMPPPGVTTEMQRLLEELEKKRG